MPNFGEIMPHHVLQAIAEYDDLGAAVFLDRYGFGTSREYLLVHEGRSYDSKAVLGVAHRYATGVALTSTDFSGGRTGAAKVLSDLGFEVTTPENMPSDVANPETGSWREVSEVGSEAARSAWAIAAREVLIETACRYHSVVTYKELAGQVQRRTGTRTSQLLQHWIGDVLLRVATDSARSNEPNLSSLCVNAQGSVGDGYSAVVQDKDHESIDLDAHAARQRLLCYRYFDAVGLPADGGAPALTPQVAAVRSRARKKAQADRTVVSCPTCHMALLPSGICGHCD